MGERLVVIGGDAAGMSAASQARRLRGPEDLEIVAFERGPYTSYSACGIPYLIGGTVEREADLIARAPDVFRSRQAIDVRIRHEVEEVDLERRAVRVTDLGGGSSPSWESFDELVIAVGATPHRPPLQGIDAAGVFGVQTLSDGLAVRDYIERESPSTAVVVGGGYIGIEMAEAMKVRGLDVTLIEMAPEPMSTLDPGMGCWVRDAMTSSGITVHVDESVRGFETRDGRVAAVVTEQRSAPADIVILGLGSRPNVALAEAAGIEIGVSGAIAVDQRMHASADGVWAAGDCAEKFHLVARRGVTIPLGTHANKEGRTIGINIGGGYETFPGVLGTAVSKMCSLEVGRTGLNEKEATRAGLEYLSVTVDSTTRAGYFPGAAPIKTKMLVEKTSGRLLGAQIVGQEGAAKRIDMIATALWHGMGVDEMLNMDISYAPPFAPVWDPVLITARKAWQLVEETRAAR